ncbi:CENPB DNA-binding domain-containing protein 1 [Chionoecetes opilio]|uniref:CENPB DNA-binding domain-containing protein 1 n=1 Tax=Chionoecetes opilio TaxID=41210 RepID=A0A8J5CPS1_CHIOP|nr:CENPB DNA-binding domain-containing protein 1 [Chionoecetes opilio]
MSTKRVASGSASAPKPKKCRKSINLETKLEVLKKSDEGMRLKDIANLFNLAPSTVVTIKKDKNKIKSSAKNATPLTAKLATRHRPPIMEEMERLLALWVDDMCMCMTNILMQEKARSLYDDLLAKDEASAGPNGAAAPPPFNASKGWLERFKNRNHLHSVTQSGEAASADKEAAQAYLPVLKKIIEDKSIFNYQLSRTRQVRALEEETAEEDDPEPQLHLTRKILADVISKFESGIHDIVNNDPNRERSLKFENTVRSALTAYKMLHQEKVHQAQQTTITSFFTKPAATSPASSTSTSSDDDAPTSPQ